ncbi:nuclease-related domain-containing protein [Neobacillus niacini]|uniref:nuclease-related domain-containing protein n=1 Tax=Neobacillus niacini TaxID=86668 RepID=UPI0007ABE219|nr:nuclease-related domain-containing protein [Neobacillus niacini]MEC1521876.1 nuclease-related domain-containing protein [Neobacillus niacini]
MLFRARPEKLELTLLKYLKSRMESSYDQALNYNNLAKGYEGELKSDIWLKGLTEEWLILHDLLFEYHGSNFQIDTLIIAYEKIYLLDVKYFEGDYSIKDDKWYNPAGALQKNPLHQLERCETLLQKLLLKLGHHYKIESYLIFNNPEFHLNTTSINPAIIFPTQLNRFLKKLNQRPVKLNKKYYQLAQQLVDHHQEESPYTRLPEYSYEKLQKGIICSKNCNTFFTDERMICKKCGCKEEVDAAVLRSVKEFTLLFPDKKITVDSIHDWCGGLKSKKAVRRILSKYFVLVGKARASHYVCRTQ